VPRTRRPTGSASPGRLQEAGTTQISALRSRLGRCVEFLAWVEAAGIEPAAYRMIGSRNRGRRRVETWVAMLTPLAYIAPCEAPRRNPRTVPTLWPRGWPCPGNEGRAGRAASDRPPGSDDPLDPVTVRCLSLCRPVATRRRDRRSGTGRSREGANDAGEPARFSSRAPPAPRGYSDRFR